MRTLKLAALSTAALIATSLGACATVNETLYSDDRLARITAEHFGVAESDIRIYDRRTNATGSYYNVQVLSTGTTVRCHILANIGGIGLMHLAPTCGDQLGRNPLTGR